MKYIFVIIAILCLSLVSGDVKLNTVKVGNNAVVLGGDDIYLPLSGGTMRGDIDMNNNSIINGNWLNVTYITLNVTEILGLNQTIYAVSQWNGTDINVTKVLADGLTLDGGNIKMQDTKYIGVADGSDGRIYFDSGASTINFLDGDLKIQDEAWVSGDNNKLYFGQAQDYSVTYDGSNLLLTSENTGDRVKILGGTAANMAGGGWFQIGDDNNYNIVFDDNDLFLRNNGATNDLYLQRYGGNVYIGTSVGYPNLVVGALDGGSTSTLQLKGNSDNQNIYLESTLTNTNQTLGLSSQGELISYDGENTPIFNLTQTGNLHIPRNITAGQLGINGVSIGTVPFNVKASSTTDTVFKIEEGSGAEYGYFSMPGSGDLIYQTDSGVIVQRWEDSTGDSRFYRDLFISADNRYLTLGAGGDAGIYYNGADLYIEPALVGAGKTVFREDSNQPSAVNIRNTFTGTSAYAGLILQTDDGNNYFLQHSSGRTVSRASTTLGGWLEMSLADADSKGIIIDTQYNQPIIFATNLTRRLELTEGGLVNITGDVKITGNITGNQFYAELWGKEIGDVNLSASNTYNNITSYNNTKQNGFIYNGNGKMIPQVAGLYQVISQISFSGTASQEYHLTLGINGITQDNCHTERVIGTGADVGSASITCLAQFSVGDDISAMIENIDSAGNPTIHSININFWRVGI